MFSGHLPISRDQGRSSRTLHPRGTKATTHCLSQGFPTSPRWDKPLELGEPSTFPSWELRGTQATWGEEGRATLGAALCLPLVCHGPAAGTAAERGLAGDKGQSAASGTELGVKSS